MRAHPDDTDAARSGAPAALITGGARGIGAACGVALRAAGWRVALVDACADHPHLAYPLAAPADLEASVARAAEAGVTPDDGPGAIGIGADVRVQAEIDDAAAEAAGAFGRLDAVVAAAGAIVGGDPVWDTSDDAWAAMLDINLTGVWRTVRAGVPHLLAIPPPRSGRVVTIASAAAVDGLPLLGAYTAAKHGVAGLTKALAVELGREGITANAVCPGSTRTAMLDASAAVYRLADAAAFVPQQPIGRLIEPAEIAAAVVWLCSPGASAVTGSIVAVDGGMTAT